MNKKYLFSLFALIPVLLIIQISDQAQISDETNVKIQGLDSSQQHASYGHLSAIQRNSQGEIIGYFQSDNTVTNGGENCGAVMLFGSAGGTDTGVTVCTGAITSGFRYIGLEESATAVAENDVDLNDPADSAGLSTPLFGTIVWTNSTGTGSEVTAVISKTFTNTGASETITGAGLFNASSITTRGMYAHGLFASSATVATSDTLEVTWTIQFGGGTVP